MSEPRTEKCEIHGREFEATCEQCQQVKAYVATINQRILEKLKKNGTSPPSV